MKGLQKGEYIQVINDLPTSSYGVQYGDIFQVVENCLTSEKTSGYACKTIIRSTESKCNDIVYLTASEVDNYSTVLSPSVVKYVLDVYRKRL